MKKSKELISTVLMSLFMTAAVFSQGITTSSLKGKVIDEDGNGVSAATVVVVHVPSGTQYGTITRDDGRYNIRNMRVGGPYSVAVSFVGFETKTEEGVFLSLNKTSEVDLELASSYEQLEEVTVSFDKYNVINSDRTGAMTNISGEQMISMPTMARSQIDMTRLTPQSDGNSFGGRNNLYNNFSLDGSIFNNSFGLDYATPGGQSDAQPVSLDAIEQIQVSIAPFDVREGGFTGAGINAVTKSGTNTVKGTAYYFFRNESLIGSKVGDIETDNLDFSAKQFGMSVGGPIIKNKLFFFVNAEMERRDQLAHGFVADDGSNSGPNVTSVIEDSIQMVRDHAMSEFGYETGAYQGYNHQTSNNKLLVKLDYNISNKHKFTIRYNMLDAWKDILPHPEAIIGRGPTSFRLPFENSSYKIYNNIHSVVGELNSMLSDKISNSMMVGYTAFRDHREPFSAPWPVVDIFDANGNLAITMGSEMFSTSNVLNTNVFQFSDNLTLYMEKHTITAGVNFELLQFENSFNLFYYPWFQFGSVQAFLDNTAATGIDFNAERDAAQTKDYVFSYLDAAQLGVYLQDEFQVSDKLNLSLGLRADIPMYFNEIEVTPEVQTVQDFTGWVDENGDPVEVDPSAWPSSLPLWSPRFGFNYDVKGDKTMQLRGGSGIFSGRIPFVWLGNQSSNSGIFPGYTFQVNATASDFHYPQVWKNNLAADAKIGDGWLFTVEGIFAKDINAVVHRNYNMKPPSGNLTGTGDTRAVFQGDENDIYSPSTGWSTFFDAGTIVLNNTREGYQYSLTGKISKAFDFGLNAMVAYTYMESKDYTSIPAEIAADAFQRSPVVGNPNFPMFSWSRYGLKHRIISSVSYKKSYGKMATGVSMFFEAGQGNRYSYVYAGDLNNDRIPANNDLLYIPTDANDINFGTVDGTGTGVPAADAGAQWTAFNAFIEQDPYLSTRRGDYAERNGAMLPWYSQLDFRIYQDFGVEVGGQMNRLQLSLDIMNIGNMLNSNWGVRQFAASNAPVSVNGVDSNGTPWLQFNTNLTDTYINDVSVNSKWQMQIGLRYIFN